MHRQWVLPEPGSPYCAGCLRQRDANDAPIKLKSAWHMRALLATIRPDTLAGSDSFTAQWSCAECSGRSYAALRTVQSLIAAAQAREKLAALRGYPVETLPPSCQRALSSELRLARRTNLKRSAISFFHIDAKGKSPPIKNHQPARPKKRKKNPKKVCPVLMLDGTSRLAVPAPPDDEDSQDTGEKSGSESGESDDGGAGFTKSKSFPKPPREPLTVPRPAPALTSTSASPLRSSASSVPYPVLTLDGTLSLSVPRQPDGRSRLGQPSPETPDDDDDGTGIKDMDDCETLIVIDCDLIKTEVENVGCEVECETDDATAASEDDADIASDDDATAASEDATVASDATVVSKTNAESCECECETEDVTVECEDDATVACHRDDVTPPRVTRQRKRRKT